MDLNRAAEGGVETTTVKMVINVSMSSMNIDDGKVNLGGSRVDEELINRKEQLGFSVEDCSNVGKFKVVTATKEISNDIALPNIEAEVNNMHMYPIMGLNSLKSEGPSVYTRRPTQAHAKSGKSPTVVQQVEEQVEQAYLLTAVQQVRQTRSTWKKRARDQPTISMSHVEVLVRKRVLEEVSGGKAKQVSVKKGKLPI